MRLGAYTARLRPGSRAAQAYGVAEISERHRHRWEVSNAYRDVLAEYGLRLSGQSPDGGLVEVIELPEHAWFIGCQFHPELKSRPTRPHPLFAGFVGAALRRRESRGEKAPTRRRAGRDRTVMAWTFARTPFLIAGPCVVEPGDVLPRVADALARLAAERGIPICFKASFDKANRARLTAERGPGLEEGLRVLERVSVRQRPPDSHRHSRAGARRAGGAGGRRAPDPRVSLPPDRSARRRRSHRSAGEREEGPVDARRGDGGRGREGARGGSERRRSHRARDVLRLRRPGRGHAELHPASRRPRALP